MSDLRQLPLFPTLPGSSSDINRHTELRDTISLFQQHLQREGKSEHTIKAFTADLHLLAEHTGETTLIGNYTTRQLNEFLRWLEFGRGVPCSRKSYARRVTTLKVYFKWLHSIGALYDDPAKAVLQRSGPAPLAEILSDDEIAAALHYARLMRKRDSSPDKRPEVLFRLLLDTGIKKNETGRLEREHIDSRNPQSPLLLVRQKSARDVFKERRIALDPDWVRLLDEYMRDYGLLDVVFKCTTRNLEYILEDIGKGAGIEQKISFEMLRWTSAVRDYRAGVEPDDIRDKLGLSAISWQETFGKIKQLTEQQLRQESAAGAR